MITKVAAVQSEHGTHEATFPWGQRSRKLDCLCFRSKILKHQNCGYFINWDLLLRLQCSAVEWYMAHIFNEMRQLLPVAILKIKNLLSLKLTAEIPTIVVTLLTEDLLLRLQLVQCSSAEWTWHTFSMKWGNFCPWPKISLAILKMNWNCLHWLRMPLMFLHPFHFPNFPFSSVLFNAQNNLLTFWRAFFNAGKKKFLFELAIFLLLLMITMFSTSKN